MADRIVAFWNAFTGNGFITAAVVIGVLAFSVLYFYMIKFLLDNDSKSIVVIFIVSMVVFGWLVVSVDQMNSAIFLLVPAMFLVAIFMLYPVEVKRIIWNRKAVKVAELKRTNTAYDKEKVEQSIDEIIRAVQNMSKNDVGAIIVLTASNLPSQILDSGTKIDSDISSELIESIFFPKTPLHDGAMVISGTRIVAAGCFLPLSQKMDNIPKDLGTRHRAGIGVTETVDVTSIIVSEETGIISIAKGGKITRYADTDALKKTLTKYFWQEFEEYKK
ncbi:MAG: diadenylate cyclase [Clostridia bacterium]|nr:diadenylate cyclase [Clostridia bacterium]